MIILIGFVLMAAGYGVYRFMRYDPTPAYFHKTGYQPNINRTPPRGVSRQLIVLIALTFVMLFSCAGLGWAGWAATRPQTILEVPTAMHLPSVTPTATPTATATNTPTLQARFLTETQTAWDMMTPTITPSATLTPTITLTPTLTYTPSLTPTDALLITLEAQNEIIASMLAQRQRDWQSFELWCNEHTGSRPQGCPPG